MTEYPYDLFLSYSREDREWVDKLKADLEAKGVRVWLDRDQIEPGQVFARALESAFDEVAAVAIVISPASAVSEWVKNEYYLALSLANDKRRELRLIPILYGDATMPPFLRIRQAADFSDLSTYEVSLDKLTRAILPAQRGKRKRSRKRQSVPEQIESDGPTISWLHLSDFHTQGPSQPNLKPLLADLKKLRDDAGLKPDLLLMTGDLACGKGAPAQNINLSGQFRQAGSLLDQVANECQIDAAKTFIVPGDHDVNRNRAVPGLYAWLDALRSKPDGMREITAAIQNKDIDWQTFLQRLTEYRQFLEERKYAHLLTDPERLIWHHVIPHHDHKIGIAGLNTAWSCGRAAERAGDLWFGSDYQIGTLFQNVAACDVTIALAHHPSWWAVPPDSEVMEQQLAKFDFFLHGHEFLQRFKRRESGLVTIAAGNAYAPGNGKAGYSIARVSLKARKGEVWLRCLDGRASPKWMPDSADGLADAKGCVRFELAARPEQPKPPARRSPGAKKVARAPAFISPVATNSSAGKRVRVKESRVFLCHSSSDKAAVRSLYARLKEDGLDPWLDEEDLLPGHDWQLEITKAVRTSSVVLVCLSNASITKGGFVQKEIKFALDIAHEKPEGTIFIIPVRLDDCTVPERLGRWHWVNLNEKSGYNRLLAALRARNENSAHKAYKLAAESKVLNLSGIWHDVHLGSPYDREAEIRIQQTGTEITGSSSTTAEQGLPDSPYAIRGWLEPDGALRGTWWAIGEQYRYGGAGGPFEGMVLGDGNEVRLRRTTKTKYGTVMSDWTWRKKKDDPAG